MVAYNFQKQFVEPIRSGLKTHTIRKNGKRRHAEIGERLQLYTGMRTRGCEKIITPDPVCIGVYKVEIDVRKLCIDRITLDGIMDSEIEDFAVEDGFASAADMHAFWLDFHGVGLFHGTMIEWKERASA